MAINIFIGTSPNGEDKEIEDIYEYTLRKNSSSELSITWMKLNNCKNDIWNNWNTSKWFTPFSGLRWAIPHACNFKGRAIYTDVDMINLKDITELYDIDMQGKPFAARKGKRWGFELCVMVIDCEIAGEYIWDLDKLKKNADSHKHHRDLISNSNLVAEIDPRWNCLDGENRNIEEIFQLHFTNMSTQPWRPSWFLGEFHQHPRKDIIDLFENYKNVIQEENFTASSTTTDTVKYKILL